MTTLDTGAIDLPPLTIPKRIRTAATLVRRTLRGEHVEASAFSDGMRVGFDGADIVIAHAIQRVRDTTAGGAR